MIIDFLAIKIPTIIMIFDDDNILLFKKSDNNILLDKMM